MTSIRLQHSLSRYKKRFKIQCYICDKYFNSKIVMMVHRRFHFSEKPHTCLECGDKFAIHSCLKSHYLQHKLDCVQETSDYDFDLDLKSIYANFESD